jgi:hypothetical protein
MKPISSILYDSMVLASWRILPVVDVSACSRSVTSHLCRGKLTRVNQLLLRHFPALVALNLGLECANLVSVLESCNIEPKFASLRTVSDGSASMTNLFCLRSCARVSLVQMPRMRRSRTLNVIFMVAVDAWVLWWVCSWLGWW